MMAIKSKKMGDNEFIRAVYTGYDVALSLYDYDLIRKANNLTVDINKLSIASLNFMPPDDVRTVSQLFFLGRHIHMKSRGFPKSVIDVSELVSGYCFMAGTFGTTTPGLPRPETTAVAFEPG